MSANVADALTICQSLIDQGSRNANVYWRITSALYQDDQIQESKKQLLAESAKRNQSSMDRGALKIACLTKSGDVGISACQRYLELTNEAQAEVEVEPVNEFQTALTDESQRADEFDARQAAYNQLVKNVQSGLNKLGFDAGTADGVPGARTRNALQDFYITTRQPAQNTISEQTLADLNAAQAQLSVAQVLLQGSQQALRSGDAILAQSKLGEAENSSLLLSVPPGLKSEIQARLGSIASNQRSTEPQRSNDTFQQATAPTELSLPAPAPTQVQAPAPTVIQASEAMTSVQQADFDQLMTRIETMQFAIQQMQRQQFTLIENMRVPVR